MCGKFEYLIVNMAILVMELFFEKLLILFEEVDYFVEILVGYPASSFSRELVRKSIKYLRRNKGKIRYKLQHKYYTMNAIACGHRDRSISAIRYFKVKIQMQNERIQKF